MTTFRISLEEFAVVKSSLLTNLMSNKMDPSSSFDPETGLCSLAKKCLNLNKDTKKEASLSNLTAKYNSTRKNVNVFGCTANSKISTFKDCGHLNLGNKALGDGFSSSIVEKPNYPSSSDDESDTGLTWAALAAKHKSPIVSINSSQVKNPEQDMLDVSSEDEYSDTRFSGSLQALAAKHKAIQNPGPMSDVSSCLTEVRKGTIKVPDIKLSKVNLPAPDKISKEKSLTVTSCREGLSSKVSEESEKSADELNPRYISACFLDDSDSDDPFTLNGLALKHARTVSQSESGSVDDKSHFKPKELQRVSNFHRHYSKSESDQFAVTQMDSENISNKEFRNESSTSLGSLKGNDSPKRDFKFSLGCSIPQSFKSKHMGLTSSLGSDQIPQANLNSSFSDPDVSIKGRRLDKISFQHDLWNNSSVMVPGSPFRDIGGMGGINLACAIKSSSSTNITQEDDNDPQNEQMDEGIVTLLDNMSVDEDVDANKSNNITSVVIRDKKDKCCLDSRYILKVKSKLRTMKCSSFGKVVCKQWRPLDIPYIRREEIITRVVPFKFTSPSPDDVMAGFRDRRLQSSSQQEQHDNSENKQ